MRRFILEFLIIFVSLICIGFSSMVTFALPGQQCPKGTKPDQYLGTCATCNDSYQCGSGSDSAAGKNCTEKNCDLIAAYLNPTITLLSALVGVACVISIIMAGIQYITSGGDPGKASQAKSRILNSIVALLAFAFLYGFLEFIIPGGVINPGG